MAAFDSSWVSSTGPFVSRFEEAFARFLGVKHAISCCNGTCALHLALMSAGIGPGDEVIVPAMTYVATANAVRYVGAEPVFADCDPGTWTIDPASVERLITDRTRAVIPVHFFGVPADLTTLMQIAGRHALVIVEDAAQAHGAMHAGQRAGSWGEVSTFSFYGNKILATGEGGMVCTDRDDLAARVRKLRGQGASSVGHYHFDEIGYNYRMTNLACAIGLAQLERFEELQRAREAVSAWYDTLLDAERLPLARQDSPRDSVRVPWIYGVVMTDEAAVQRDDVRGRLAEAGIETRPFFPALHTLPMYQQCRHDDGCRTCVSLGERGIMLPTHSRLARTEVEHVVRTLAAAVRQPVGVS
jgi:perosamine synthetase